jgi:hypothetical protein|tara:strand:- start:252 stop:1088 length:837 start_codon:yes stop_codon:yes gene_type:complete
MAQNVAKPRIYINIPEWLASTGTVIDPVFYTLPVSPSAIIDVPDASAVTIPANKAYIAILGHQLTDVTINANVQSGGVINGDFGSGVIGGFSIAELNELPTAITLEGGTGEAGSILLGTFYDFPHSPDLNLSLSYSYEGIKETTTKGGATLTNSYYHGVPEWGTLGAWELGGTAAHAKSGRKIWNLSWSFLSSDSAFPTDASLTTDGSTTTGTLLVDDSFQRCIHLLNGGQIPFIFCSDSDNPKQDNFAIAKFDMKSFQFSQSAPNLYTCKIRIKEIW